MAFKIGDIVDVWGHTGSNSAKIIQWTNHPHYVVVEYYKPLHNYHTYGLCYVRVDFTQRYGPHANESIDLRFSSSEASGFYENNIEKMIEGRNQKLMHDYNQSKISLV